MRKFIKNRLKNERGLTLVELLAVIVILAIIGAIAFVFIGGIIENSKKDAHIANAQQIISAAKLHEASGGELPVTLDKLIEGDYLDQVINPWTKEEYSDDEGNGLTYSDVKVSKGTDTDNTTYSIEGFTASGCSLSGSVDEQTLNKKGRDACN